MAQQMLMYNSTIYTFRPWNPKDINAPLGKEEDVTEAECPSQCIPCVLVEKCFKTMFKEHIDEIRTTGQSHLAIFKDLIDTNNKSTILFRWVSWAMSFIGHYLLFVPIIRLISRIPFAGWLLANMLSFAVLIFTFVWSTMLHFLVMGVAWVYYRPLKGLLMLSAFAVCFYIISKPYPGYDPASINIILDDQYGTDQE